LVTFAIITWVYRLVLFLGIALAVYLFFFKLLGIILFMVELSWFIAMPVVRELHHWWQHRAGIPSRRKILFYGVLAMLLAGLAIPWRTQIDAVGVARAEHQLRVYAPYPARLQSIHAGGPVKAGETLIVLDEPDIASRMRTSEANARSYEARLSGLLADPTGLEEDAVTRQRLNVQFEEARAARSEIARLNLQTPFAGVWLDVNPDWKPGQWVGRQESLGMLVDPRSWQVDAYVAQDQVHRMLVGDHVRFYPDGQTTPLSGRVLVIGSTRASQLSHRMLSSRFGGPVPTTTAEHALIPSTALFQVLIQLDEPIANLRETRGHLKIEGERRSLLADGATHVLAVFMRESGF
jgi:putative peptide zinc metalloprotease protein